MPRVTGLGCPVTLVPGFPSKLTMNIQLSKTNVKNHLILYDDYNDPRCSHRRITTRGVHINRHEHYGISQILVMEYFDGNGVFSS